MAECARLESVYRETYRGFKSRILRQIKSITLIASCERERWLMRWHRPQRQNRSHLHRWTKRAGRSFAVSPVSKPQPPRAACRIEIDNAHISSTLYKHLNRKFVKVNAVSICNVPHSRVTLTVKIYKVGLLVDHFVSFSATNPSAESSSGYRVVNQGTRAVCLSGRMSDYYGVAYSKAIVDGKWQYAGNTYSPKVVSLPCESSTP